MLPYLSHPSRWAAAARCGCVLVALTLAALSAGCSNFGLQESELVPSPTLETGQRLPDRSSDTEPFAVTNEGKQIESRLLDRQRKIMLPD